MAQQGAKQPHRHHEFGLRLRGARISAGLSTEDLAPLIASTDRSIRRYESGERLPSVQLTESWARVCDTEPKALLASHPEVVGTPSLTLVASNDSNGPAKTGAGPGGRIRWRRWQVLAAAVAVACAVGAYVALTSDSNPKPDALAQTLAHAQNLKSTYSERTGGPARVWGDYRNAGGRVGRSLGAQQVVRVSCRVAGFRVKSGNRWWYLLASPPWNKRFFVTADAFFNVPNTRGVDFTKTRQVDPNVPICP